MTALRQRRLWPFYSPSTQALVANLIGQGRSYASAQDPLITEFEERFAHLHCDTGHALFCGSGTAALFSAYFGLGLEPGAEVLVPTNTFRATVTPLLLLNLQPVLCDSDPITGNIDIDDAQARVTSRTAALVVTHLAGRPVNMERASALARKHGLALIEDCSHAHGTKWRGIPVGSFGDAAAFSLGTKKMISGGTAGILLTRDRTIYERAVLLGQPKSRADILVHDDKLRNYLGTGLGANLRGSPLTAALALEHLDRLPDTIKIKNSNLAVLGRVIAETIGDLTPPMREQDFSSGTWYSFPCTWANQEVPVNSVISALQQQGFRVRAAPDPLHRERLFVDPSLLTSQVFERWLPCRKDDYPATDRHCSRIISWDTRDLYEPAEEVLLAVRPVFQAIADALCPHC